MQAGMAILVPQQRTVQYRFYDGTSVKDMTATLAQEEPLTIFLNGRELVTLLCTPVLLDRLVVGFLYAEGIIGSVDEIVLLALCPDSGTAEVWLEDEKKFPRRPPAVASGCSGGITYLDKSALPRVDSNLLISRAQVLRLMRELLSAARMHRNSGGVHTSALAQGDSLIAVAEDVGRHNTVDKIIGESLISGLATDQCLLLTTGRISSEMLMKAARIKVPVVASLTSPTDRAVGLADRLGVTLVGYARGHRMRVYSHLRRIQD